MKSLIAATAILALSVGVANATVASSASSSDSSAKAKAAASSKSRATASQLNAQQLKSMNYSTVNVDQSQDHDNDYWWAYGGGIGSTSNVAPATGNFEGTRDVRLSGPLGIGFSIPLTMRDETAVYNGLANRILSTWSSTATVTPDLMLDRALQCEMIPELESALDRVGKVCPE